MKATVETEQNEWMREKSLGVFERGVRAMNDEEMQDLSHEWLDKNPMRCYWNVLEGNK